MASGALGAASADGTPQAGCAMFGTTGAAASGSGGMPGTLGKENRLPAPENDGGAFSGAGSAALRM